MQGERSSSPDPIPSKSNDGFNLLQSFFAAAAGGSLVLAACREGCTYSVGL